MWTVGYLLVTKNPRHTYTAKETESENSTNTIDALTRLNRCCFVVRGNGDKQLPLNWPPPMSVNSVYRCISVCFTILWFAL